MATIIGFEDSTFDPNEIEQVESENHQEDFSTDNVLDAWKEIKKSMGEEYIKYVKESGYYIRKHEPSEERSAS